MVSVTSVIFLLVVNAVVSRELPAHRGLLELAAHRGGMSGHNR